jgi:lantibiotic modifying enzyme
MDNCLRNVPELSDKIEIKLREISDCLLNCPVTKIDLMGGKSGIVLFWAYYSEYSVTVNLENTLGQLIFEIFQKIKHGGLTPTYASGISGIGWTIEHLRQNGFVEIDTDIVIGSFDEFLYPKMLQFMSSGNYDYLHGALGIGLYYLNRLSNPKTKLYIVELINELEKHAEHFSENIAWESRLFDERNETVYNLSMSHGIASIVSVLSQFYQANIECERVRNLVNGAVNFLLGNKNNSRLSKYTFPAYISKNLSSKVGWGRLAWCYNDLGIAMALLKAGQVFKNEVWKQEAINTLINTTIIKDFIEAKIMDAGLCHGTAGIAHIYNRAYIYTGLEIFKDSAKYWYEQTLKLASFDDGLAGYKTYRTPEYGGMCNDYGFLEGIAGIGLAIISAVSDIEPAWDGALLL